MHADWPGEGDKSIPAYLIWIFRDITVTEGPQRAVAEEEE